MASDYIAIIDVEISDPWDFGTAHGTGPFQGCLIKFFASQEYGADKLGVVKLDEPLDFQNMRYEYLLVQSRHVDTQVAEIENGKRVLCNLSAISEASTNATDPLIASRNDPKSTVLVGSVTRRKNA